MLEFSVVVLGMLLFCERTWKHHCVTLLLPFTVPVVSEEWMKPATEARIRDEAGSLPRGRHDVTETGMTVTGAFAAGGHQVTLSS